MTVTETSPTASETGNRWLEGNFGPVPYEVTAYNLPVTGSIPAELAGRYLRSGPNPIAPNPSTHHWFIGDGMLHGVDLHGGEALWYRNRWVVSPAVADVQHRAPVPAPTGQLLAGSGNTNVIHHAGRIFAINELSCPYEVTPELDTVAQVDFGGPMPAGMTAHPKFDPVTGEMHVMAYSFVEPFLRYHVISADGRLIRTEEIAVGGPVMVHDMGLTETRAVVLDLPVVFDIDIVAAGGGLPYRWDPDYTPRVGLMPRDGTGADTQWVEIDPCYVYHPLNAYDDGDRVVMDVVRHPKMFATDTRGPNDGPPTLDRWIIDPVAGTFSSTRVDDRSQEFPRADERLATRPHRFGYTVSANLSDFGGTTDARSGVIKYDFDSGTSESLDLGAGRVAGEFVFVPASESAGEDEGWLLGYVYDRAADRSELMILDAHDLATGPLARVHLPVRVPAGFHGNWIPDRALA